MSARAYAKQLLEILHNDRENRLLWIDDYLHGHHSDPYVPDSAGNEYLALARRSTTNLLPLVVSSSCQALYVDGVRPGRSIGKQEGEKDSDGDTPEWVHWQDSRLDSRQMAIYRAAAGYGHSFTITETVGEKVQTKGLSPLRTSAIFEDPANDDDPIAALTVIKFPAGTTQWGTARMWDDTYEYEVKFKHLGVFSSNEHIKVRRLEEHGNSVCPVTRFAIQVDLDGRTLGVVEPLIVVQDRLNQTVLDLLVVQSGGSFKVRTISGMALPIKYKYIDDGNNNQIRVPDLDDEGNQQVDQPMVNALSYLWAEDKDVKFGTLDETPLDGYLASLGEVLKHLSAISQTPPHYLLGDMVNLSAEALQAAELTLTRKNQEFRVLFGESWERVFRLAAELKGNDQAADDYKAEVIWRDMEARAMAKMADALLKLYQIGAPKRGLFRLIPGITNTQLREWDEFLDEEDGEAKLAEAIGANRTGRPVTRPARTPVGNPATQVA